MAFAEKNTNGLITMHSDKLKARHAFTTRYGGVSKGGLYSLNLGTNRGDDPDNVRENYRRICALMGVGIDDCALTVQIHGNEVRTVTEEDRHVYGTNVPYEADGIVTAVRGMPVICYVADCVPVLLCDAKNGVIGAVHCGWRSSVTDILGNALREMGALGAEKNTICAAMGAAIGKCCFETDEDVPQAIDRYLGKDSAGTYRQRPDGKYLVDLREANKRRLLQLGLLEENIDLSEECTMCSHEKYWSHRYTKGQRGTQAAIIVLD